MTKKDLTSKFYSMMQTYIDLIVYSEKIHNHDMRLEYSYKLQAVRSTALLVLDEKYFARLDVQQRDMFTNAHANQ